MSRRILETALPDNLTLIGEIQDPTREEKYGVEILLKNGKIVTESVAFDWLSQTGGVTQEMSLVGKVEEISFYTGPSTIGPKIEKVIFNNPATIVYWHDGTKTVVKAQDGEPFDKEKGLAMAFMKKVCGNKGSYNEIFKEFGAV